MKKTIRLYHSNGNIKEEYDYDMDTEKKDGL